MADEINIGRQLLDVPFPEMLKRMGLAIAEAQYELDRVGIRLAQMMSGQKEEPDPSKPETSISRDHDAYKVSFGGEKLSMLELGFTPTFYQFVDTIVEIKLSISMTSESSRSEASAGGEMGYSSIMPIRMSASAVNASYASKFSYSAEGSSLLRTKIVPVPAPPALEQRIRALLQKNQ